MKIQFELLDGFREELNSGAACSADGKQESNSITVQALIMTRY
jgi:hypothetical protein